MEKTHYKKLKDPNYIGAYELMNGDGTTREMVVTIDGAKKEELKNAEKNQGLVLYIKGQKPMIVNTVNAKAISSSTGSEFVEDWFGKQITLYVVKIKAFGEIMDALRVKKEPPVFTLPEFGSDNPQWDEVIETILSGNNTLDGIVKVLSKHYIISETTKKAISDAVEQRI